MILVTNDDGINSPGLKAAVEAVVELGQVVVVAPTNQQTAAGRSLRGDKGEVLKPVDFPVRGGAVRAYHCDCTPARAVLHALELMFRNEKPELIVSGINYGENLGTNVTGSGTVGAAIQAACVDIPGLAVSVETRLDDHFRYAELDWDAARFFANKFAKVMLGRAMPEDVSILNVNVPASATHETPWRLTRISRQQFFVNRIKTPTMTSTLGDSVCSHGFDMNTLERDSDIFTVRSGQVSVTPVSIDLTARTDMAKLAELISRD